MENITQSSKETKKLGEKFADTLKEGQTLALQGDLGSGKTTFIQGLAKGLGINQRIVSPTFILMRKYLVDNNPKINKFYHVDLYRLDSDIEKELKNIGVKETLADTSGVVAIEWADKIVNDFLPENTVFINFENIGKSKRKISIENKKLKI